MKRMLTIWLAAVAMAMLSGCTNNNLYEDMPAEIQSFISQYYPGSALASFASSGSSYTVIIKDGPTISFGSDYRWTRVDGNGSTLPQVLMFNDLPPELYSYLQETENTNDVFCASRTAKTYTIELLAETLTYDISTGEISGHPTSPTGDAQ